MSDDNLTTAYVGGVVTGACDYVEIRNALADLRFVERDGKRILQVLQIGREMKNQELRYYEEWVDVRMEGEG